MRRNRPELRQFLCSSKAVRHGSQAAETVAKSCATVEARRMIFFARYEASQFGSPYIETEHLLLGLLREDKRIVLVFFRSYLFVEEIRKKVEQHTIIREKVSTSVDLPLSNEGKRVLVYA